MMWQGFYPQAEIFEFSLSCREELKVTIPPVTPIIVERQKTQTLGEAKNHQRSKLENARIIFWALWVNHSTAVFDINLFLYHFVRKYNVHNLQLVLGAVQGWLSWVYYSPGWVKTFEQMVVPAPTVNNGLCSQRPIKWISLLFEICYIQSLCFITYIHYVFSTAGALVVITV